MYDGVDTLGLMNDGADTLDLGLVRRGGDDGLGFANDVGGDTLVTGGQDTPGPGGLASVCPTLLLSGSISSSLSERFITSGAGAAFRFS